MGALVNGLLSGAVALVGLYVVSSLLNIPTSLKILELSQPNHPALQRLLRDAPGTYQHSLQVAESGGAGRPADRCQCIAIARGRDVS